MSKTELIQDILFLIIITFLVQYFIMARVTVESSKYITNSLGKIYSSTIIAIFVPIIYVLMIDFKQGTVSCNYYIGLGLIVGIITYAYRNQLGVTDYDWANWMIEHQSTGILVSQPVSNVSTNFTSGSASGSASASNQVQYLAAQIVSGQQNTIDNLKQLVSNMKINGVYY